MLLETNRFEFDEFLLDAGEQVLLRDGKAVSITPKAFLLLLTLVENHGHLVEKEKLIETVWKHSFGRRYRAAIAADSCSPSRATAPATPTTGSR